MANLEFVSMVFIKSKLIPLRPLSDYYIHMFDSLLFGITLGLLFKKYFPIDTTLINFSIFSFYLLNK